MNAPKPFVTLSAADKIYFAVARSDVNGISYVHTLVSNRMGKSNSYDLIPHTEISGFDSPTSADIYAGVVRKIMAIQSTQFPAYNEFMKISQSLIADFHSHVR